MIFLDHIPHDIVAWLTLRNYGFSDAAEFFVFISGYLAGFIYGPIVRGGHFLAATKRLVMRPGKCMLPTSCCSCSLRHRSPVRSGSSTNPMYEDEFNVHNFLQHPDVLIGQALSLRYKPVNLDVLPLYISLMLASPLILWCWLRRPKLDLAWLGRPVRPGALVRLEFRLVFTRDNLVLQSVCLAIAVYIRGMVWCRRCRPAFSS